MIKTDLHYHLNWNIHLSKKFCSLWYKSNLSLGCDLQTWFKWDRSFCNRKKVLIIQLDSGWQSSWHDHNKNKKKCINTWEEVYNINNHNIQLTSIEVMIRSPTGQQHNGTRPSIVPIHRSWSFVATLYLPTHCMKSFLHGRPIFFYTIWSS